MIKAYIDDLKDELKQLSEYIYKNPEIGLEEYKSSKAHMDILKKYGFAIKENFLGFETAFKATYKGEKPGPTIAYLAEYDALPDIGHGCGHNLLGATSTGAGIILRKLIDEIGGTVYVLGSPAEESSGVKVDMANQGVFDNVDIAMISHPGSKHRLSGTTSELVPLRFTFKGKSAHAASSPEKGINALDGCIMLFNSVNALREHIKDSSRIHGVIKEGGKAANIVPELAIADFYIRTPVLGYMEELKEKVINCGKASALATGCELEISVYEKIYKGLVTNETLSKVYGKYLEEIGVEDIFEGKVGYGSSDMGDVSQVCPAIHPSFSIVEKGKEVAGHTVEFGQATFSDLGYKGMEQAIYALVGTAVEIIEDEELLVKIKDEFKLTFNK
ncbi:MAG TPA: M20 family metallopeptidase [Tissierellaceae bacterium]|nr:M20 family metallopeptidase [Tissierellaceae bacterium]